MSKNPRRPKNNTQQNIDRLPESTIDQGNNTSKQSASKIKLLMALIIVVCAIVSVTHWPALSAQANFFDDIEYLNENLLVQNPSWTSARRFLTEILEPSTVGGYYQPLAMISLMADYALGGRPDNLQPFHQTSLALHTANTALIIVLLYLLFGHVWAAAAAGLLFGLHPMTVEPLCWVSERKTLLAAFFALWSLVLYVRFIRKNNWKLYLGCLAMYILALMSKPTSLPLPVMLLLMDYWPLKRLNRRAILEKLPLFVVAAVFALITYVSQSRAGTTALPTHYGPQRIPLILCHNIIFYLYKIIWPANLSSHYAFPEPLALSNHTLLTAVIGTAILVPLLIVSLRWTHAAMTGWLLFFIAISPTIGIIGFTNVIAADKFAYLPSLGLLMILTSLLSWLWTISTTGRLAARKTATVIAIVLLVLASTEAIATRRHLTHWRDTVRLCEHILTLTPNAARVHSQLGLALKSQGKLDEAIKHYTESLRINPGYANAHNDLALVLTRQDNLNEAIAHYNTALKLDPDLYPVHSNLADALARQGKLDQAVTHYTESLRINPDFPNAHTNLAVLLLRQGNTNEAVTHLTEVLRLRPSSAEAHNNLGVALEKKGKLDRAIHHYRQALRIRPDYPQPMNAIAHILINHPNPKKRNITNAIQLAERAAKLTRYQNPVILDTLAAAYAAQGRFDRAINTAQTALDLCADQKSDELANQIRNRLLLYRQAKPYHQPQPPQNQIHP